MASVEKHGTSVDRISTSKRIDFTTMIPTELITEIFLYCLPDEIYIDPHIREAPLLLGQICRSWRSIALHTPKLWSSVAIKVKSTHKCVPSRPMIELWLHRSSRSFLSFGIDFVGLGDLEVADSNILAYFLPHSRRWGNMRLDFGPFLKPYLDIPYVCASSLENAEISLHLNQLTTWIFRLLADAPSLRRLLFQPFPVGPNVNLQDITIPWAQLTHIMLPCELLTSSPISLLRQCPRLMECVLFRSGPLYDDSLKHLISPFVLPDLRPLRIELEVHSMETLADFFDALVLPTLRTLTIKYGHSNNNEWPQSNFISLLSRSLCHLESLTLIGIRPSEEAVIRILQMTTASLTTLEIDTGFTGICLTDRTLDLLTAHDPLSDQEPHECLAPNSHGSHCIDACRRQTGC